MKLVYEIEVAGFDNVPHQKDFHRKWLAEGGPEGLFEEARKLIRGERQDNRKSGVSHGSVPQNMPGWRHIGCLGKWVSGNLYSANSHCLEVFQDPNGKYFLVDQSVHGDFRGHRCHAKVIEEIPISPLEVL